MVPERITFSGLLVSILSIHDGLQPSLLCVGIDITGVRPALMKESSNWTELLLLLEILLIFKRSKLKSPRIRTFELGRRSFR